MEVAIAEDPMGAGFRDTITEATIMPEDITEATPGIITLVTRLMEQPSASFLAG